jgi:hypothetical protein
MKNYRHTYKHATLTAKHNKQLVYVTRPIWHILDWLDIFVLGVDSTLMHFVYEVGDIFT